MADQQRIRIAAHRGGAALAPENSLLAFRRALSLGVDALECDVRLTCDGVPVVFHDSSLHRLTGISGMLAGWTSSDLATTVRLAEGEPVPSLLDLCVLVKSQKVELFVEIKEHAAAFPALQVLREHFPAQRYIVGSFEEATVRTLLEQGCERVLQLGRSQEDFTSEKWKQPGLSAAGIARDSVSLDAVRSLHACSLEVWTWTVNEEAEIRRVMAAGVDVIITDHPDRAIAIRNSFPA